MGNIASNQASWIANKTWKVPVKTGVLRISDWGRLCLNFETIWTATWAEVAPTWAQVGAKLRHLGAKLGRSWSQVGRSWGLAGRS